MIGLDQVIGAFVIGQVILSTLQTVSNVVLSKKGSPSHTPAIRSPPPTFVVPPDATMKTVEPDELRRLCDVSIAFREAVELALLERDYTANSIRIESYKPGSSKNVPEHKKPYDLSLRPVTSEADEGLMPKPPLDTNNQGQYDSAENATIPSTTPANATIHSNNENQSILIDYLTTLSLPSRNNHDSMEDNTPPTTIRIRAYAANQFAELRSLFGISDEAFRRSLLESGPYILFSSNSKGAARTGGIFFFSPDGAYLIKTIKKDELPAFLRMLREYVSFMKENGRQTLLSRYCGMFDVCFESQRTTNGKEILSEAYTMVIMNSVFPLTGKLVERFDLKGSTIGRDCSIKERLSKGSSAILKDINVYEKNEWQGGAFHVGSELKAALMTQLKRDVELLKRCQVIDYSLLVGVEPRMTTAEQSVQTCSWQSTAAKLFTRHRAAIDNPSLARLPGVRRGYPVTFYLGIIDFLQPFNSVKYVEWRAKSLWYEAESYSCVPPESYAKRFLEALEQHFS